ncbi:MAG TPA: hypothetical protein VIP98_12830 [Microlunatus sp.]
MLDRLPQTLLGAAIGLVGLIAMLRLVTAGFPGSMIFAAVVVVIVMAPWVLYAARGARRSAIGRLWSLVAALLTVAGLLLVWWGTVGPVLGLACSFAGFVIIWRHDRRPPRDVRRRLFRIEDSQDPPAA